MALSVCMTWMFVFNWESFCVILSFFCGTLILRVLLVVIWNVLKTYLLRMFLKKNTENLKRDQWGMGESWMYDWKFICILTVIFSNIFDRYFSNIVQPLFFKYFLTVIFQIFFYPYFFKKIFDRYFSNIFWSLFFYRHVHVFILYFIFKKIRYKCIDSKLKKFIKTILIIFQFETFKSFYFL